MELVYIAASIMIGLGALVPASASPCWVATAGIHCSSARAGSSAANQDLPDGGLLDAVPMIGVGIAMYLIFVVAG